LLKDSNSVSVKYFAIGRETRCMIGAREKLQTEFVLKIGDGFADRGLRQMQPSCRLPVALALYNRGEIAQMSEFHR
jgi:hypothetical protein